MSPRGLAAAVCLAAFSALESGCYVEAVPPPVAAYGYEPQYYDGYLVYYDEVGRPYYYMNGAVLWVPPTAPVYVGLVNHWHAYRPAYVRWNGQYGYRYRTYRYGGRRYR
jgi:hypothetical protein